MTNPRFGRFGRLPAASLGALLALGASAFSQTADCERYRAELASLGSSQSGQQAAETQRARSDLERMRAYHSQIGCNRGGGLFGQQAPQECGALGNRIRQAEGNLAQLQQQANVADSGVESRRRQLQSYLNQSCRGGGAAPTNAAAQRPPNFFEQLFGGGQANTPRASENQIIQDEPQQGAGLGGSRVVCVRTCDGYFFPLPAGGREGATDMCQALCPESETQVFYMAPSGDIERGVSASGQPYLSLANAGRYKKSVVPNCACRKEGEKWVDALKRAEDLLGKRDQVVSTQKAEELSRPKAEAAKKGQPDPKGKKAAATPAVAQQQPTDQDVDASADPAALPTASKESAGIGPQSVGGAKTIGQREGQVREVTGADGKKQTVRVVAPNMFVAPKDSGVR